ncbi:MAG TPA: methyl-coenzyme M reductase operon protein D [Candidatus Methanofastidiosa archaeon]|nr:methyl-coenzyme M reductase operon protein D [Candidatus Methanofastidiosa archaeon]
MKAKPELQIFPLRLMSERTIKPMVDELEALEYVSNIGCRGFSTTDNEEYKVGWIWIEIESDEEEIVSQIEDICDRYLSFGYDLQKGRFTKYRVTTSDHLRGLVKEE